MHVSNQTVIAELHSQVCVNQKAIDFYITEDLLVTPLCNCSAIYVNLYIIDQSCRLFEGNFDLLTYHRIIRKERTADSNLVFEADIARFERTNNSTHQ